MRNRRFIPRLLEKLYHLDGVAIPHKGCPAPNQQVLGKSH